MDLAFCKITLTTRGLAFFAEHPNQLITFGWFLLRIPSILFPLGEFLWGPSHAIRWSWTRTSSWPQLVAEFKVWTEVHLFGISNWSPVVVPLSIAVVSARHQGPSERPGLGALRRGCCRGWLRDVGGRTGEPCRASTGSGADGIRIDVITGFWCIL